MFELWLDGYSRSEVWMVCSNGGTEFGPQKDNAPATKEWAKEYWAGSLYQGQLITIMAFNPNANKNIVIGEFYGIPSTTSNAGR